MTITSALTIKDYQDFVREVYGPPNDLYFDLPDLLNNVQRFAMRSLKGIRKKDEEKCLENLIIASSFFVSALNRLHINLEDELWQRFPYRCSYCASLPCRCEEVRPKEREIITADQNKRPQSLADFQMMFEEIYPSASRTLDYAGIHMAEELGEMAEAILAYRGEHTKKNFNNIKLEAADFFSCVLGILNSLKINFAQHLSDYYKEGCPACKQVPCACTFSFVIRYVS